MTSQGHRNDMKPVHLGTHVQLISINSPFDHGYEFSRHKVGQCGNIYTHDEKTGNRINHSTINLQ